MTTQSAQQQGKSLVRTQAKLGIPIVLTLICLGTTIMLFQTGFIWYIAAIPIVTLVFIIVIGGYTSSLFDWTGFSRVETKTSKATEDTPAQNSTTTVESQPRKTLWDWMQLLIVPIVLALVVSAFNAQQNQNSIQNQKHQEQATALETYLDRMSDLLFTYHLYSSAPGDEVRRVADARTFTVLQSVDVNQKGAIILFLYQAGLITAVQNSYAIVRLDRADLTGAILMNDYLDGVDLHDTFMNNADLRNAILNNSNLSISIIENADLSNAYLNYANLHWSRFRQTKLIGTALIGANLRGAILKNADLSGAKLSNADLSCYISPNNPTTKHCVDLSGANLTGATVTPQQLSEAKSLKGTIMPNGSVNP